MPIDVPNPTPVKGRLDSRHDQPRVLQHRVRPTVQRAAVLPEARDAAGKG